MNADIIFNVRGLAVIGASENSYFSNRLFENLKKRKRLYPIFPVNPKQKKVYELKCFPSLKGLEGKCSHAFIMTPAQPLEDVVLQCANAGIKNIIILSSFNNEKPLKTTIPDISKKNNILVLGSGSLGIIETQTNLVLYCGRIPPGGLPSGRVSVISNSGGLINEFFRASIKEKRWGIRRAICAGEELVLSIGDILKKMVHDPITGCIVLLIASLKYKMQMVEGLEEAFSAGKPVVIFPAFCRLNPTLNSPEELYEDKSIMQELYFRASAERGNAFIAGSPAEAAEAAGAIAPGGIEKTGEEIPLRLRKIRGKKIAIITVSNGIGEWIKTKVCEKGFILSPITTKVKDEIKAIFPPAIVQNPVDLTGKILSEPEKLKIIIEKLISAKNVDAVILPVQPPAGKSPSDLRNEKWLGEISELELLYSDKEMASIIPVQIMNAGIFPQSKNWIKAKPVRGIELALDLINWKFRFEKTDFPADRKQRMDRTDFEAARNIINGPPRTLSHPSSRKALETYGISFSNWILATTPSKAISFSKELKSAVSLEVASPELNLKNNHKFRKENIKGDSAIRKSFLELLISAKQQKNINRILGMLVEKFEEQSFSFNVTTFSMLDGSLPLMVIQSRIRNDYHAFLCPSGQKETINAIEKLFKSKEPKLEPVQTAEMIRRISFFAYDFRNEVQSITCRLSISIHGQTSCLESMVVIGCQI